MEGGCVRWLNETYLESAIRSSENDQSVKVISSEVTSMAAPGSHFMSNMYRATVHIKRGSGEHEISLVVKVAPEKQELLQMTVNGDVFELELRLLRHISPEMHKLMQKLPSVNCQPFTPKYICSHSCPSAIIMEDLTKTGFRTPNRKQGLNYNHSSLVMKTLARYHAASVVLNGNSQHLLEIFKKKDPGLAFRSIIDAGSESGLKEIKKEIESWPGYEIYIDKIENMSRNSGDKWFAARSRFDGDFNVLIHGDLWLTNLMFKYSEDGRDPVDVSLDTKMTYTPPTWLNSEFLERALKSNGSRPKLTVIRCDVDRATKPGDNFGSEMYRATLRIKENGDTEDTSVIIKSILRGGDAALEIEVMEAFIREAKIYSEINVLMLKEAFLEEYQPFAAKCFYTSPEPSQGAIVLEDLKRGGFRLANISLGLDLKHCLLVIKTIARFHASSLILLQKDPNRFESFMEHHFVKHSHGGMATFLRVSVEKLLNEVDKWAGYERYVDALKSLMDTPMTRWVDALRRDDTEFRVLTHGDLWLNNIMFSYSEESGEVQQVRFVDFQLSSIASPAIDLLYFMNTSVCPDVLENDFQTLVDEYYNALCATLSKLGYKNLRPTKELLNSELNKRGLYGALAGFSVRSVALCDRDHVLDIQSTESYEGSVYLSNAYKTVIRRLLPLYEKWGWLKF